MRIPILTKPTTTIEEVEDEEAPWTRKPMELPRAEIYMMEHCVGKVLPGAICVTDPVEQFLAAGGSKEDLVNMVVAKESLRLRTICPTINGVKEYESVIDCGSQIVSMSLTVAQELGLTWDPDIIIQLQSANKTIDRSLGLAKNMPFRFGDIIIYLQVHIINDPAYQVLLGRPFDVITESNIQNRSDGSQTVTLRDPKTGARSTVPTFECRKPRPAETKQVFQKNSRN